MWVTVGYSGESSGRKTGGRPRAKAREKQRRRKRRIRGGVREAPWVGEELQEENGEAGRE